MYKFCLTHKYHSYLENIGYQLVGQGKDNYPNNWIINIDIFLSKKK